MIETLGLENVPDHIWNCDETGLQDHFLSTRVVAEVGSPCFEVTGGEKGETTTCLASLNAAGGSGQKQLPLQMPRLAFEAVGYTQPDPAQIKASLFAPSETTERPLQETPEDTPTDDTLLVQTPPHPLHGAVQPVMFPPQQHTCLSHLTVPEDIKIVTPPPLAQEVEVEMQPETAEVSFRDLIQIPVRERPTTSCQRAKPPSWNLTSNEHFAYVQGKGVKGKGKGPKAKPNNLSACIWGQRRPQVHRGVAVVCCLQPVVP
ncbi:hypothetical protein AAFF_G00195640 [Aldrovandia affinis]|uniref:Uncharacterized protein n=1 Tax=Aldrovandia affinis TaxID=143900 RepID=A0AAD7W6V3_9TELE|nr:hypothetical protein AAFF_G00195640 [Aldrovandia affinis]